MILALNVKSLMKNTLANTIQTQWQFQCKLEPLLHLIRCLTFQKVNFRKSATAYSLNVVAH